MKTIAFAQFFLSIAGVSSRGLPTSPQPTEDFFNEPWRPSKHIDSEGFLSTIYPCVPALWEEENPILRGKYRTSSLQEFPVLVRQVPGDGNCLFHAIAVALYKAKKYDHLEFGDFDKVRRLARSLRADTTTYLKRKLNRKLYLTGDDYIVTKHLLDRFASKCGLTPLEYCESMATEGVWGGGPEIVALSNLLKRPIHLYQLVVINKRFHVRRWCCFGSPKFDNKADAIHILSADSRFPDVHRFLLRKKGNHFLAVFPQSQ